MMSVDKIVTAPIDAVTVTEDRAHVKRCGVVEVAPGVTRVRIEDVAPVIADKTLRVRASGGVSVGEARVVRRTVSTEPAAAHAPLVRELEECVRRGELGAARVARLETAITLLDEAQYRVMEELADDAARGSSPGDGSLATRAVRAFDEREAATYADVLAARREQREIEETLGRLRARATQVGHKATRVVASIEMTLVSTASETVKSELVVEYLVPGACWRPQHTATLRKDGALSVTTDACVWQNTGEAWESVALRFSTERPSLGQKPPALEDDEVMTQRRSDVVRVEQRDEAIQRTGLGGGPPPAMRVPGIDDGGDVRVLLAKARATVPSDGRPYRVPSLSMETTATSSLVAYPELAEAVLVRAKQSNTGTAPLLAGPVDLVRESGFVGRTKLGLIAPGESFELGFGPDPHVRLRRELETVDEEAGLLPSSYVGRSHRVRVHVSNLDDRARRIEVTERVPVSEIEKVDVHFDEKKTQPRATPDADGFVRWTVELAARGRATLELRYVIRRHKDVVGL